jgi:HopA1 effector protein family
LKNNANIIAQIIEEIQISPARQIIFRGEALVESYTFLPTDAIKPEYLIKTISDLIYQKYYTSESSDKPLKINQFVQKLKIANASKPYWSKQWKVVNVNSDGSVIVDKNELRKLAKSGEYLKEIPIKNLQQGDFVKLFVPTELLTKEDGFFHVYSKEISDDFNEAMIRFYFNVSPEGAIKLVELLSKKLTIPFHFKCLKKSASYTRADAGVLYFDKRYFFEIYPILQTIFTEISPFLKSETPLFSYRIANGIGFAENPPEETESFGTTRSKLIAEAIVKAFWEEIPTEKRLEKLKELIESVGFDFEKLYLNPNSRFPYQFD